MTPSGLKERQGCKLISTIRSVVSDLRAGRSQQCPSKTAAASKALALAFYEKMGACPRGPCRPARQQHHGGTAWKSVCTQRRLQHDRASASLLITPSLPHHPAGSLLSLCSCGCSDKLEQQFRLHPPARRPFDRFAARRAKQQRLCTTAQFPEFSEQRCFTDCSRKQGGASDLPPLTHATGTRCGCASVPSPSMSSRDGAQSFRCCPTLLGTVHWLRLEVAMSHLLPHPRLALDPSYFVLTAQLPSTSLVLKTAQCKGIDQPLAAHQCVLRSGCTQQSWPCCQTHPLACVDSQRPVTRLSLVFGACLFCKRLTQQGGCAEEARVRLCPAESDPFSITALAGRCACIALHSRPQRAYQLTDQGPSERLKASAQ